MKLRILCAIAIFSCAGFAQAQWATLDSEHSSVTYVTTKLKDISEIHAFDSITGSISNSGEVAVVIDSVSINSMLELRDDRIREFLFKVMDYPSITVSADIDLDALSTGVSNLQFPAAVNIVGAELAVTVDALVSVSDSSVTVSSRKPIVVFASQVGLTDGVAKLSELAGGLPIGGSVPVSFSLSFDR